MKQIIEKRKDIVFFIKLFPLTKIHPNAYKKSKAILCKKSLKMLEDAFQRKKIPEPECDTDGIDENIKLAAQLGITGTPAIILPDGRIIKGAVRTDVIIKHIDKINNQ